jgi:hypothetical protein
MDILLDQPPKTFDSQWNNNDFVTDSTILPQCDAIKLNPGDAKPSIFQLRL